MSAVALQNLLDYLTATLSVSNRKWLAERLVMPTTKQVTDSARKETEYIASSPAMMDIIAEGDKQIQSGNFKTTTIDAVWNKTC